MLAVAPALAAYFWLTITAVGLLLGLLPELQKGWPVGCYVTDRMLIFVECQGLWGGDILASFLTGAYYAAWGGFWVLGMTIALPPLGLPFLLLWLLPHILALRSIRRWEYLRSISRWMNGSGRR